MELLFLGKISKNNIFLLALPFLSPIYMGLLFINMDLLVFSNELLTGGFIFFTFFLCLICRLGTFFSVVFIYILLSICLFQLSLISDFLKNNYSFIFFFVAMVVVADTSGYVFGKLIGGPKPFKILSPGKTFSGYLGGLIMCLLISLFWPIDFNLQRETLVIFGVLFCVSVQFGDLLESIFKRKINIKDSGSFFPGHGGFLDRFDGFISSVFVLYIISFILR